MPWTGHQSAHTPTHTHVYTQTHRHTHDEYKIIKFGSYCFAGVFPSGGPDGPMTGVRLTVQAWL